MIHLPIKSLTELDSIQQSHFGKYLIIKEQAASIVRKDGFIALSEIQKIADSIGETKGNLQKKIRHLVNAGYLKKTKYGIVLTSKRIIHKQLNLFYKKNGKKHTPFIKCENASSEYKIELLRLYFLMKQIRNRYFYQKYGRDYRRIIDTAPEYSELSLDKICLRGKYRSKTTVISRINDLVKLGLIKKFQGRWNNTKVAQYDCNAYLIKEKKPNAINWNLLNKSKDIDYKKLFNSLDGGSSPVRETKKTKVSIPVKSQAVKKKKPEVSEVENKFQWFLEKGRDLLVDIGVLSRHYKSFGLKKRKISRSMFPRILAEILNDNQLRMIFLTVFKPSDVKVTKGEGTFYNTNLDIPRYRASNQFFYHKVELTNHADGNYTPEQYKTIITKQFALDKLSRNNFSTNNLNLMPTSI